MKPGWIRWSRSRRYPCTLERVATPQTFFPAGVGKTTSVVSEREALFSTWYVRTRYRLIVVQVYVSVFLTPGTQQQTITDPIVPTLPPTRRACATHPYAQYCCGSLCLSEPAVRISPSICRTRYQIFLILFHVQTQVGVYLYRHYLSPCCFFCALLCVIQQCHCSSCARHSAPTTEAGSILSACRRRVLHSEYRVLHSEYYITNVCCRHRHWPTHRPAAVCDRHFCSVPIIPGSCAFVKSNTTNRLYEHRVQQSSIRIPILTAVVTDYCVSYTADC